MLDSKEHTFHFLPEPVPLTEQEWPEDVKPLVHTRTMAFNQEEFIRECIESILMQKTTFPVQILIHDDASNDHTADIIREYEQKYPKLIRAYYQEENTYSIKNKEKKVKLKEEFYSWRNCKYEAICEGDDYWTDPFKLQKQAEFLETNKDYTIVCTNYSVVSESKEIIQYHGWQKKSKRVAYISQETILERYTPQMLTVMFRTKYLEKIVQDFKNYKFPNGDVALFAVLTKFGPCHFIDEVTGCYRQSGNGIWAGKTNIKKFEMKFITYNNLLKYFSDDRDAKKSIFKKMEYLTRVLTILSIKQAKPFSAIKYLYNHLYYKFR